MPQVATDLDQQAHKLGPQGHADICVFAYNSGENPACGTVRVGAAARWKLAPAQWELTLAPGERKSLELHVQAEQRADSPGPADWIKLEGDFGPAGRSVLAFRLLAR